MASPQLEASIVGRLRRNAVRIPPYPAVAKRLRALAKQSSVAPDDLAAVLASDPALAGMAIARASTAEAPVATLAGAIARLGIEELIGLSLATDLGRGAVVAGPLSALRRDAWRCALLSARLAQELAPTRGISADEAHLAGLLHDFGAVVVIAALEDVASEEPLPALTLEAWSNLIDKLHVEFGRTTAVRWGLPTRLVEVIEQHHKPVAPLAKLIELVDRIIATLDRSPAAGMTALSAITELSAEERARIAAAIPQVVQQMSRFAPPTTRFLPMVVPIALDGEPAWPVDLAVVLRTGTFRASLISPSSLTFSGPDPLVLNWLTEIAIQCEPTPIAMLANIKTCDRMRNGSFLITAQPFAIAGEEKLAWLALVEHARHASYEDAPTLSRVAAR